MDARVWLRSGFVVVFLAAAVLGGFALLVDGGGLVQGDRSTARGTNSSRETAAYASETRLLSADADPARTRLLAAVWATLNGPVTAATDDVLRSSITSLLDLGQAPALQALAAQLPPGPVRDNFLGIFTFAWAARDPDAALAWASRRPDDAERGLSLMRVCNTLGDTDPANALALAGRLDFQGRQQTMETIAEHWLLQEPALAREWVLQQPAGEQRDGFVSRIAALDARHFPTDAAAFALAHLPPGDAQDETIITIVHEWAARDATGAASWVRTFPESEFRLRAMHEIDGVARYPP